MSNVRCPACGAPLAGDQVICTKCGRLVRRSSAPPKRPAQRPARPVQRQTRPAVNAQRRPAGQKAPTSQRQPVQRQTRQSAPANSLRRTAGTQPRRTTATRSVPRPVYDAPPPEVQTREAEGKFKRNKGLKGKLRLAARGCCAALLIAVIYMGGALIQTTRVRLSGYNFKSNMKMTYSSYGKAIDNYFEDGHWSANLLTGKCTYTGKTKHGEEYELIFRAGAKVKLTGINIDGEPVEKDMIETKVMGMFI